MSPDPLKLALTKAPHNVSLCRGGVGALVEKHVAKARVEGERAASARAARALELAAARLDAAREEAQAALARNAVALAVEIARTLVRKELMAGTHNIESMVREALAASGAGRGPCTVHLNPADIAQLQDVRFRAGTELEPDEAVARGDVHVETPHGLLVRENAEALRSIHERLLGELS